MRKYEIEIVKRQMTVRCGGIPLKVDGRESNDVTMLFASLREAVETIARDMHATDNNGNRLSWERFEKMFAEGELSITLAGESRQMRLASFYIQHEFHLVSPPKVIVNDGEECIYDSFGFSTNVDDYQRSLARRRLLNEQLMHAVQEPSIRKYLEKGEPRRMALPEEIKTFRVGVLGQTGAGKSTFINALLGRKVMPSDSEICTGVVIDVVYVDSAGQECVVPFYYSNQKVEQLIQGEGQKLAELKKTLQQLKSLKGQAAETWKNLTGKLSGANESMNQVSLEDKIAKSERRLKALREARTVAASHGKRTAVEKLPLFVSVSGGSLLPEIVRSVEVRLHIPLLKHVTLVDTPGLRDPNPERSQVTVDALAELHGWMYAIEADRKSNNTYDEDIAEVESKAMNPRGMLVMSKADKVMTNSRVDIDSVLSAARRHYESLEIGGVHQSLIPAVSAWGPDFVAGMHSTDFGPVACRELLKSESGFGYFRKQMPDVRKDPDSFAHIDNLQHKLYDHFIATGTPEVGQFARDFFLEVSGILSAARQLNGILRKDVVTTLVDRVDEDARKIISNVQEHYGRLVEDSTRESKVLQEKIATQREHEHIINSHLEHKRKDLCGMEDEVVRCKAELMKRMEIRNHSQWVKMAGDEFSAKRGEIRSVVLYNARGDLWGSRVINLEASVFSNVLEQLRKSIEQLSMEFPAACKAIVGEEGCKQLQNSLEVVIADMAKSVSLTPVAYKMLVSDYEDLFESFDTCMERLLRRASELVESNGIVLADSAAYFVCNQVLPMVAHALDARLSHERSLVEEINEKLKRVRQSISDLEKGATGSAEVREQRLARRCEERDAVTKLWEAYCSEALPLHKADVIAV